MGASMASRLQQAGWSLSVFNRTKAKAHALLEQGADWCESPAAVAAASDALFSIVGFPPDVEAVYLGDDGVLSGNPRCTLICDMTTSTPALARGIAETAAARGIASLDAPVSGGDVGAREGRLAIMAGGDEAAFRKARPLFEIMGETIGLMGGPGAGQNTKMCNQILIAGTMIGVCESLLYAARSGLDRDQVIGIIGKGAAASWSINTLGPRIAGGDFEPGFYVEHFIKDMGIALREARALNLALPGLALVHQLYVAVQSQGFGRKGTQALMMALQTLNGER